MDGCTRGTDKAPTAMDNGLSLVRTSSPDDSKSAKKPTACGRDISPDAIGRLYHTEAIRISVPLKEPYLAVRETFWSMSLSRMSLIVHPADRMTNAPTEKRAKFVARTLEPSC